MNADNWMDPLDTLWACIGIVSVEIRVCRDINGLPAINDLAEFWTQFRVCAISACPKCITANGRNSIVVKVGNASRMLLVDQVTVSKLATACIIWPRKLTSAISMLHLAV